MLRTDDTNHALSRRRTLLAAGGVISLAGCLGFDDDDGTDDSEDEDGADDPGGEDGTDDSDDAVESDDSQNGGDENGGDEPGELSLSALTLDGESERLEAFAETDISVAVTAENLGGDDEFEVSLLVVETDASDDEPAVEATETLTLDAGEQTEVTFDEITTDLGVGTYDVMIRDPEREETQLAGELVFTTPIVEVTTNVYLKSVDDGPRPEEGSVVVSQDGEVIDEKNLRINPSPTLEIPEGRGNTYTLEVENIDGGIYPSIETTVTPTSYDPFELDFVTGYEFQTADSFNFTVFRSYVHGGLSKRPGRGSLAETGEFFIEYDSIGFPTQTFDIGDPLPPFETEVSRFVEEHYGFPAASSIGLKLNDQRLYRSRRDDVFSEEDDHFLYEPSRHGPPQLLMQGIDALTDPDPEQRRFVGEREYRDRTVDEYEVVFEGGVNRYVPEVADEVDSADRDDFDGARVLVDPDTGYILRFESEMIPFRQPEPIFDAVEIWEFYDHNDVETLDTSWIDIDLPV